MKIFKKAADMRAWCNGLHISGETISLVPTMGYFHEGHLSLMDKGRSMCSTLVVSIFVNPTQFGENEDLEAYPMDIERDLELAREKGAKAVFLPERQEMYPPGSQTYVTLEKLPAHLCGISRPVHFRGVATVVTKLFNIIRPDAAVFGAKDYQQLQVIRQMNQDLNFGIKIIGAPIVREPDGLAMSSRNAYLKPEQRESALSLSKSCQKAKKMIEDGIRDADIIKKDIHDYIDSFPHTNVDYISICDPASLDEIKDISDKVLFALAVQVGRSRLIDNILIEPAK